MSHIRGTIPALKGELANLSNPHAQRRLRAKSAALVAAAAVIVAVLGYAIYREWQIHIVDVLGDGEEPSGSDSGGRLHENQCGCLCCQTDMCREK